MSIHEVSIGNFMITIGLEVHVQLATQTKLFCGCPTLYGQPPNTQVCPVCLGMPGALPVLNVRAVELGAAAALALNCRVANYSRFDRKNYFYADLPKGYQISQYHFPLASGGWITILSEPIKEQKLTDQNHPPTTTEHPPTTTEHPPTTTEHPPTTQNTKCIRIMRAHLEEDAGKSIHGSPNDPYTYIDLNRAGVPLLEIVSEPDITSPQEAYNYLCNLKTILQYAGVSECNMQEGSLRCDANISLRPKNSSILGTKTEIKNLNSFNHIRRALAYEAQRQYQILSRGDQIIQATYTWLENENRTELMRTKEQADDYRYFPDPDLCPLVLESAWIDKFKVSLPELPQPRCIRFVQQYGVAFSDAEFLTQDRWEADYFESCCQHTKDIKEVVNWIKGYIHSYLNDHHTTIVKFANVVPATALAELLNLISSNSINRVSARSILEQMLATGKPASEFIKSKEKISDPVELQAICEQIISSSRRLAQDYHKNPNALNALVGRVLRATSGRADAEIVQILLQKILQ